MAADKWKAAVDFESFAANRNDQKKKEIERDGTRPDTRHKMRLV